MSDVRIVVSRSAAADGAVLVFIDTTFEPNGSDGGPGLRVLINDDEAYVGIAHQIGGPDRIAPEHTLSVSLDDLAYQEP